MSAISIEHKHTHKLTLTKKLIVKNDEEQKKTVCKKLFFLFVCSLTIVYKTTLHNKQPNTRHILQKKPKTKYDEQQKKPKSNLLKWTQDVKQTTEALTFKRSERTKKNI